MFMGPIETRYWITFSFYALDHKEKIVSDKLSNLRFRSNVVSLQYGHTMVAVT